MILQLWLSGFFHRGCAYRNFSPQLVQYRDPSGIDAPHLVQNLAAVTGLAFVLVDRRLTRSTTATSMAAMITANTTIGGISSQNGRGCSGAASTENVTGSLSQPK